MIQVVFLSPVGGMVESKSGDTGLMSEDEKEHIWVLESIIESF